MRDSVNSVKVVDYLAKLVNISLKDVTEIRGLHIAEDRAEIPVIEIERTAKVVKRADNKIVVEFIKERIRLLGVLIVLTYLNTVREIELVFVFLLCDNRSP